MLQPWGWKAKNQLDLQDCMNNGKFKASLVDIGESFIDSSYAFLRQSKKSSIRIARWEQEPMTKQQVKHACLDAFKCHWAYITMEY